MDTPRQGAGSVKHLLDRSAITSFVLLIPAARLHRYGSKPRRRDNGAEQRLCRSTPWPAVLSLRLAISASETTEGQSRVMTMTLKSLPSLMSYCPSLHLASSTS